MSGIANMTRPNGQPHQTAPMSTLQTIGVILLIFSYGLYLDVVGRPAEVGFSCDDIPSISYLLQANTVTPHMVLIISDFLPTLALFLSDRYLFPRRSPNTPGNAAIFSIGMALVYTSSNFLKFNTGILRPYFLFVCRPNQTKFDCSHGYVQDYQCQGDAEEIRRARVSFPSLHASMTLFAMVYCIIYLWYLPVSSAIGRMAVVTLQSMCITWMTYVPISRVQDHRHHVTDVIVGSIWGTVFALLIRQSFYGQPFRKSQSRHIPEESIAMEPHHHHNMSLPDADMKQD